ncbi:MAG TPA: prepilin-type N-terminal cleavage/methylation domain-containing protein, partial [Phycisphaerales bacterium]|nr:prepilin-type N-terminal cleavage/methylation domain-containing protein [Phycisphaerales bacterium]
MARSLHRISPRYRSRRGRSVREAYQGSAQMIRPPSDILRSPRGRAFSLIEMLVVISIVSLLFGLILPALSRTRAIARQTICQGRLRQWGLAFEAYAVDHDGFYPHIDGRDRTASDPQTDAERADY